jgi:hypothetical protein
MLNDMGVKLHIPSFKETERTQLTSSETIRSENISKVRIHVEKAIQRTKTFHIQHAHLPSVEVFFTPKIGPVPPKL